MSAFLLYLIHFKSIGKLLLIQTKEDHPAIVIIISKFTIIFEISNLTFHSLPLIHESVHSLFNYIFITIFSTFSIYNT